MWTNAFDTAQIAQKNVIAIDTTLKISHLKILVWGGVIVLVMLMTGLLPVQLNYRLALMVLTLACVWLAQLSQYHLTVVSTLPNRRANDMIAYDFLDWQLQGVEGSFIIPYQPTTNPQAMLLQAKLLAIQDMGCLLVLTFDIIEPYQKPLTTHIWQDQVDNDTWRQLKILASQTD
ncbi:MULTISPECIES: hypothetical protein [unclassified Moraxella]|uniref:hypothetical protein n=1 Tax=unclassified Moraxella TaxID=2685852 RepID=UPI003AF7768C